MTQLVRLNKYLAHSGVASRRSSDVLIEQGKITVNGKIVKNPATKILPGKDKVIFDGKKIELSQNKVLFALYKPIGIVSTSSDPEGRKTVVDLIKSSERLYSIGRLDKDSEGLILLTNDGDLAYKLSHPKFEVAKEYLVYAPPQNIPPAKLVANLKKPRRILGKLKGFDSIEFLGREKGFLVFKVVIHEGINHHIRRLFGAAGLPVERLIRVKYGSIELGELKSGQFRQESLEKDFYSPKNS